MFDKQLYKEGLRRSVYLAALFIGIMLLGAVFMPVSTVTNQISEFEQGFTSIATHIRGFGNNYALLLAIFAFTPLLTLYLFAFLNKRNSSDFYHSIPHKRETLYTSFTAAALTYVIGAIWVCTGITIAIYSFFPGFIVLNIPQMLYVSLGLSVGSVMVAGATLIAMSVTGSTFSNISAALLILILPRLLLEVFFRLIIMITPIISAEGFGFLGGSSHSIPFAATVSVFSTFFGIGADVVTGRIATLERAFTNGILYTTAVGLIYLCIGMLLFKNRKSEIAGSPALNHGAQPVIRIAVAFCACLPAAAAIVSDMSIGHMESMIFVIIFYAFSLAVYFAYELIVTKRLANIMKSLPGLGVLVVLNIIFISGVMITYNSIVNRRPAVNEVNSVQILSLGHFVNNLSYEHLRIREVELRDAEVISFLLDTLDRQVANLRSGNRQRPVQAIISVVFTETNGRSMRREFRLSNEEVRGLIDVLAAQDEFNRAFLSLPQEPDVISAGWDSNISDEAAGEIYAAMQEEVKTLDFFTWYSVRFGQRLPELNSFGDLRVQGVYNDFIYSNFYPITNFTPQTAEVFMKHTNTYNFEKTEEALETLLTEGLEGRSWLSVGGVGARGSVDISAFDFRGEGQSEKAFIQLLLDIVREQQNTPITMDDTLYNLYISLFQTGYGDGFLANFFFNTENEELIRALR